ncbi:mitotic checkpoint protein BUB3.1 [Tanacetum coccineum]
MAASLWHQWRDTICGGGVWMHPRLICVGFGYDLVHGLVTAQQGKYLAKCFNQMKKFKQKLEGLLRFRRREGRGRSTFSYVNEDEPVGLVLHIYDVVNSLGMVKGFLGQPQLDVAFTRMYFVIIPAGVPRKPEYCFFAFGNALNFISFGYVAHVSVKIWDKTLKCWDPKGASAQERALVGTYSQPELVYSISLVGNRVVVATAGCHNRLALSFMEGRVAMEFFELTEAGQSNKYAPRK